MNTIVLNLIESKVTLYPANLAGEPQLNFPIWSGVEAENLTISERWLKTETKPTGALHPRKHPLVPQYELSVGRIWALPLSNLAGFQPNRGGYVLDIAWQEEDSRQWHRRTYYGVTISDRALSNQETDRGFTDGQVFDAQFFIASSAPAGESLPALSSALPFIARYVSETELLDLYSYSPVSKTFVELSAGIATGRAVISTTSTGATVNYRNSTAYRNSDKYRPGVTLFQVKFGSNTNPAMQVTLQGMVQASQFKLATPLKSHLPRLDFYYGTKRLASITEDGQLFAWHFTPGAPLNQPDRIQIIISSQLVATMAVSGIVAAEFQTA